MTPLDARESNVVEGGASFSLGNRMFRVLWTLAWLALCRFTPPPLFAWRRLVLSLFGARVHPTARVHASVRIWHPANLAIGAHSLIGPGARIYNQGRIEIGSRVVVSQGAYLCASTHDVRDPHFQLVLRPITIRDGCWVAADAFVGPGVTMGDGAVLGARGAMFADAEPLTIYRGNPAIAIGKREIRTG